MEKASVGSSKRPYPWFYHVLLILVLLAAAWLRLWRLPSLPPGFWYDEAYNSMEAVWMRDTLAPEPYYVGDMGREVLMSYLLAVSTAILGVTPLACRLVNPLVAMLLLASVYRWLLRLFAGDRDRRWIALVATAALGCSFWHVVMSRTAYEAPLTPLFLVVAVHLFWCGWQEATTAWPYPPQPRRASITPFGRHSSGSRQWRYFVGAGVAAGLGIYSYTSGCLVLLSLWLFAVTWTALGRFVTKKPGSSRPPAVSPWPGVLVTSLATMVVVLPLCLFVVHHPDAFGTRVQDVFILTRAARGQTMLGAQVRTALRVFWDISSSTWRHGIPGESGFDLLSRIGFWVGLVVTISRVRRPNYLLLLICLGVTWSPALLSAGLSTMRLSAMLPVYYAMAGIGWLALANALSRLASRVAKIRSSSPTTVGTSGDLLYRNIILWTLCGTVFIAGGAATVYDYFVRWAAAPGVYHDYEGQLVDMARFISNETYTTDVLLPFSVYTHPSARFALYEEFRESEALPAPTQQRPVEIIRPHGTNSSAMVWLTRDQGGNGHVYVPRALPRDLLIANAALATETPLQATSSPGEPFGFIYHLAQWDSLRDELADWSTIAVTDLDWDDELALGGYEVWPGLAQPGQPVTLTLYWRSLVGRPLAYHIFVQLVDRRGEPVAQWTDGALADQHRWRPGRLAPSQHVLWLGTDIAPGPYLVRIGLFDPRTERRASIIGASGHPVDDQVTLGLFYVANGDDDPRQADNTLPARLGDSIELLGYDLPSHEHSTASLHVLRVQLHWQASARMTGDYTTFVQLLNADGRRVAGWDAQPLSGQYPTSRWQAGDVVVDTFDVPLPDDLAAAEYRLVTGMYDLATGERLDAVDGAGIPLPDDMITLTRQVVP